MGGWGGGACLQCTCLYWAQAVEHVTFGQLQAAQEVVVKLAKESLDSSNK